MPYLVVKSKNKEIRDHNLYQDVTTIGRGGLSSHDNPDIILPDKSKKVSRYHAAIILDPRGYHFIRDLASANGTRVNEQLTYRKRLTEGDIIHIGNFNLTYLAQKIDSHTVIPLVPIQEDSFISTDDYRKSTILANLPPKGRTTLSETQKDIFNDIVKQIKSLAEWDSVLTQFIGLFGGYFNAKRGFAAETGENATLCRVVTFGIDREKGERIEYSPSTIECVLNAKEPILQPSAYNRSVLCCPLLANNQVVGVVYLERDILRKFSEDDLRFLALLCEHLTSHVSRVYPQKSPSKEIHCTDENYQWNVKLVGNSNVMKKIQKEIDFFSQTDMNLLLLGKTGTGKEVLARLIHESSPRRDGPFIAVELPKMGEDIVESELFGHLKGAFTSAVRDKTGAIELANEGTIFLDEIGDISLKVQAKIRRAIEEKEIIKVGAERVTKVNVRIISATNIDLREAVGKGTFRQDLLERLGRIIELPTLSERREDIPLLSHYFIDKCNTEFRSVSHGAMRFFLEYKWPGNVRELRRVIEEFAAQKKETLFSWDVPGHIERDIEHDSGKGFRAIKETKKAELLKTLENTNWNITETAKILGVRKQTVYNWMEKFGISRPDKD